MRDVSKRLEELEERAADLDTADVPPLTTERDGDGREVLKWRGQVVKAMHGVSMSDL